MDFENPWTYVVGVGLWVLLLIFMFKVPTWDSYPLVNKIIIAIVGLPVMLTMAAWQVDK